MRDEHIPLTACMLSAPQLPPLIVRGVIKAALARGSRDNCTAVVARYSM